jgi:hypothetical protein
MTAELQFVRHARWCGTRGCLYKTLLRGHIQEIPLWHIARYTEYAMSLAPLLDASTTIQAHAFVAMAAFELGVARQEGLSCQSHAKSASGPLCRLRRGSIAAKWEGPDVRADEHHASRALAEADLSSAKRRPPVLIRQSLYWQACQAGGQPCKIESLRTRNG